MDEGLSAPRSVAHPVQPRALSGRAFVTQERP